MRNRSMRRVALAFVLFGTIASGHTDSTSVESGDDRFVSGDSATAPSSSRRDLFIAGFRARISGDVAGDAHAAAFSTAVSARVDGDLYAFGGNVTISGVLAGDATLAGFEVSLDDTARIAGNLRVSAGTLVLAAPVAGSVLAGAGVIEIDAPIAGDVRLAGSSIEFGERATIGGMLVYSAPTPITVPPSVAPAERVRYERPGGGSSIYDDDSMPFGNVLPHLRPGWASALLSALGTLLLLSVIAALALGLAGERVERLRLRADAAPWRALAFGFLGLSTLIGALPVAAATLLGIPLLPLLLLALMVLWTLGYLLGVHVVVQRLAVAFGGRRSEAMPGRLSLLIAGIAAGALLNFVPFVGWLLNVALLLLGLGAMTSLTINRLAGVVEPRRLTQHTDA